MTPNILSQSVFCAVIVREASSCSKWEKKRDPQARQYAESGRSRNKMGHLYLIPPFRAQETLWKKTQQECKSPACLVESVTSAP